MRKSYKFLNKVCTRRGHINIKSDKNDNNNNTSNNNNRIYIYIKTLKDRKEGERERDRERERKKTIDIYLKHKGIQWKTKDCLIQRKCFQS